VEETEDVLVRVPEDMDGMLHSSSVEAAWRKHKPSV
jgi:hypothetical protein